MRYLFLAILLVATIAIFNFSFLKKAEAAIITLQFNPVADSYVDSANPTRNYGTSSQIRIDGSPSVRTYLKFDLTGINGTVSQAYLKIYANSNQSTGYEIRKSADGNWSESLINSNNAPVLEPVVFGRSGALRSATWYTVDVTPAVTGDGNLTLALVTSNSTAASLASRESANKPLLTVVYSETANPTPTPTPTEIPIVTPTPIETIAPTPEITPTFLPTSTPTQTPGTDRVIVAASDIVCNSLSTTSSSCQQLAAAQTAADQDPSAVLIVGDLCHTPSADCYNFYYGTSWGQLFTKTYPVTGNHDYQVTGASMYFDYWNGVGVQTGRAGDRKKGYYSFDVGNWHIVALNSQCSQAGGCNAGSPQYTWLQNDLNQSTAKCTIAYYHIPLFSSGGRANNNMRQIYNLLYSKDVDIVINGHDHIYERFAPQDPSAGLDLARGIREFIVGTGGSNHTSIPIGGEKPNSEVRNTDTFGSLKLTLHPDSYDWKFVPVAGMSFTDSGSYGCH